MLSLLLSSSVQSEYVRCSQPCHPPPRPTLLHKGVLVTHPVLGAQWESLGFLADVLRRCPGVLCFGNKRVLNASFHACKPK